MKQLFNFIYSSAVKISRVFGTPRKTFGLLVLVWAVALLSSGVTLSLLRVGEVNAVESDALNTDLYHELKTFTDVISIVQRDYVEKVDNKKIVEGAIKGMLATLDPHSGYLNPEFYKELQVETRGEFGGLGIEITVKEGLLMVVAPIEGSPAERAGIQPGDAIIKIDGKFTKELSLIDAVKEMRGLKGTPITISIHREGAEDLIDVTIVRDNIHVRSVRSRLLEANFGYARINQFQENTANDLKEGLGKIRKANGGKELKGLVLDLRNNPGGLLTQAIKVSDLFLTEGVIVYTDGRVKSQQQRFFAHKRATEDEYPIVVLVNGGSASASEIVAGALKDHGRGLVLGTATFGKGSVQTIMGLDNGGALRLTTALYYTKSGHSIQAKGIEPDIVIDVTGREVTGDSEAEEKKGRQVRESDLRGAIKNPEDEKSERRKTLELMRRRNPETANLKDLLENDPQLRRALELLKSFDIFKGTGTVQALVTAQK